MHGRVSTLAHPRRLLRCATARPHAAGKGLGVGTRARLLVEGSCVLPKCRTACCSAGDTSHLYSLLLVISAEAHSCKALITAEHHQLPHCQ
eukprot:366229-Chlamydomonas_euryale.AAC.18